MSKIDLVRREINNANDKYFLRTINKIPTIFCGMNKIATIDNIEHCPLNFPSVMARTHFDKNVDMKEKEDFYKRFTKIRWKSLQKMLEEAV